MRILPEFLDIHIVICRSPPDVKLHRMVQIILTRKPDLLKQSAPFTEHIAEIISLQGDCRIAFLYTDILFVSVLF